MRIVICLLLLVQAGFAAEIPVPESTSPDGRYSFYVEGSGAVAAYPGLLMKDVQTDQVVTNLGSGGYISDVESAASEVKVFWAQDSRWFAIRSRETKRTRGVSFYYVDHGRVWQVQAPSFGQNVLGREGVIKKGRYWFEEPQGWGETSKGTGWKTTPFIVDVSGRLPDELIEKGRSAEFYSYRVVLNCSSADHCAPDIRLGSIERLKTYVPESERPDARTDSLTFRSTFGKGFGKVLVLDGELVKPAYSKGRHRERLRVSKVNGVALVEPVTVKLRMHNGPARHEYEIYSSIEKPVVVLGYESLSAYGNPDRVNGTFETMEQTARWHVETFVDVVRVSTRDDAWPAMRGKRKMNQVRYVTHDLILRQETKYGVDYEIRLDDLGKD